MNLLIILPLFEALTTSLFARSRVGLYPFEIDNAGEMICGCLEKSFVESVDVLLREYDNKTNSEFPDELPSLSNFTSECTIDSELASMVNKITLESDPSVGVEMSSYCQVFNIISIFFTSFVSQFLNFSFVLSCSGCEVS